MISHAEFEKISKDGKALVKSIKDLSEKQRHMWQQVPYLALHVHGRSGWSDHYRRAYESGYWAVNNAMRTGTYSVFVDLETGGLVDAYNPQWIARDADILPLATYLNALNAEQIVRQLRMAAREPVAKWYNAEDQEKWEQHIISFLADGHITAIGYRRIIDPKKVHEANIHGQLFDTVAD